MTSTALPLLALIASAAHALCSVRPVRVTALVDARRGLARRVLVRLVGHRSAILLLHAARGPLAIGRAVVRHAPRAVPAPISAVVVLAVDGVVKARSHAHVREEVLEREPVRADLDAPVGPPCPLAASVLHRLPRLVGGRDAGLAGYRVLPRVPVLERGFCAEPVGAFLARPWSTVASARAVISAFSHTSIVEVISLGGAS